MVVRHDSLLGYFGRKKVCVNPMEMKTDDSILGELQLDQGSITIIDFIGVSEPEDFDFLILAFRRTVQEKITHTNYRFICDI